MFVFSFKIVLYGGAVLWSSWGMENETQNKKLYAVTITRHDGTSEHVTRWGYSEIDAISLVAMRAYHEAKPTDSPIVSVALAKF